MSLSTSSNPYAVNVAFVSNVVYPFVTGGAEKRIHEIGRRLAADGHDVTVYARHFWDGPAEMDHEGMLLRAVAPERELYDDDRRSITEAISFGARVLQPLRRHCDDHDVIVASVFPYFPVLSAVIAQWRTGTPLITTWHEVWLDYWEEYLGRLALGGKLVEQVTARVPQHPVAVSNATADRLTQVGIDRARVEVIPNGIDTDWIRSIDPIADGTDILFAGRLIPEKNVELLIDAFDQVAEDHDDVTLGIIGEGPQQDQLRQQAAAANNGDRITFHGFLEEYEDVLAHMQAADLFVSPSTREGFGITLLEALAAECTVIAVDHPESAASEVLGDAGELVAPTTDDVADAIQRRLADPLPAEVGQSRAAEFDWDRVADDAEDFYRSVLQSS